MKDLTRIADELEEEIKARVNLINQMVGQLYPRILESEIYRLRVAKSELISGRGVD